MKKSILLVLLYLLIQAVAGGILSLVFSMWPTASFEWSVVITLLVADVLMAVILIQQGYLSDQKLWHPTTVFCMGWTLIAGISAIFISDAVASCTEFLPNWLESTFDQIENSWLGILAVAIVGPILEEMLFRGAVTSVLLKAYSPTKAIIYSALIFGIFHINPAQVLNAFLLGLLLGWLFYKTRSLIPGILVHILNNGLSVLFSQTYPQADSMADLMGWVPYSICLVLAVLLLTLSVWQLHKKGGA